MMTGEAALVILLAMPFAGSVAAMLLLHVLLRRWIPAGWRHALLLVALVRLALPIAPASPLSIFNLAAAPASVPLIQVVPVAGGSTEPIVIPRRVPLAPGPALRQAWQWKGRPPPRRSSRISFRVPLIRRPRAGATCRVTGWLGLPWGSYSRWDLRGAVNPS